MSVVTALSRTIRDNAPYAPVEGRPLATNGFQVVLPATVEAIVRDFPNPAEVKSERERLAGFWFVHWVGGKLYHLRLKAGGPNVDGLQQTITTSTHPWLLRSRLEDVIGSSVSKYVPIRKRPFTFLAQKTELIKKAAAAANIKHEVLDTFKVIPRFALHAKIYETAAGTPRVGVFVTLGTRYEIDTSLATLQWRERGA